MASDFQQKELSGSIFRNERKDSASQPDYRGSAKIDGEEYWVSGWIKEGNKGKWMSLAFTAKDGGFSRPDKPRPTPTFDDDDIPF